MQLFNININMRFYLSTNANEYRIVISPFKSEISVDNDSFQR